MIIKTVYGGDPDSKSSSALTAKLIREFEKPQLERAEKRATPATRASVIQKVRFSTASYVRQARAIVFWCRERRADDAARSCKCKNAGLEILYCIFRQSLRPHRLSKSISRGKIFSIGSDSRPPSDRQDLRGKWKHSDD
jgi:hypothetical protein